MRELAFSRLYIFFKMPPLNKGFYFLLEPKAFLISMPVVPMISTVFVSISLFGRIIKSEGH